MVFYKYHGTGNDFIIFSAMERGEPFLSPQEIAELCRRHTGVGADGVIFACPPRAGGDAGMRIFNADGSEAEMCGNGIRCLAKYLYEREGIRRDRIFIETRAGTRELLLTVEGGKVREVDVDMGFPEFGGPDLPDSVEAGTPVEVTLDLPGGERTEALCLSMGNPHCVVFVPHVERAPVEAWGPHIERHPYFPRRTNVEFVETVDEGHIRVRVWERGVGETQACGTGACAAFVASVHSGKGATSMEVSLPGGRLRIYADPGGHVHLVGAAVEVFSGELSSGWMESP
ncbi:diaminopimelate epimerase [Candidatus Solincola tengchongensis]|uniref:diaminopimelate epimerase n=1 Tax=Candidatus Solincola tengchongensis TaxID=2900693 RepID=UPI00257BB13B